MGVIFRMIVAAAVIAAGMGKALASPSDELIFDPAAQRTQEIVPMYVSASALAALISSGASVELVSEDEAFARASERGVRLEPTAPQSPLYGHPWLIVKGGLGIPSLANLIAEIYIHDNWSLETHLVTGLLYNAVGLGVRWYPTSWCRGCDNTVSWILSPGAEAAYLPQIENGRRGMTLTTSLDGTLRVRPYRHFLFQVGLRIGGGALIQFPETVSASVIQPPPDPVTGQPAPVKVPTDAIHYSGRTEGFFDGVLYFGIGF